MQVKKYHICDSTTSADTEDKQFELSKIQIELK